MMLQLIDEVNKALDAECYLSALTLVLTFPDICGKAQFPNEKVGKRYRDWFDEHIGKYEQCPCDDCEKNMMPYLSGEVIYSLRNSLLHQGTPNIDLNNIKSDRNKIDHFRIIIDPKNQFDIYSDFSSIIDERIRTYNINLRRLCLVICSCTKAYYEENKSSFDFFKYSIIDNTKTSQDC